MKSAAACLPVAFALACASAMAQAAGDPMDKLRACSDLPGAERTKCLDRLSREIAPEAARPRTASGSEGTATLDSWIFSETTSPIDYSPVVIASATASGAAGRLRHEAFNCVSQREYIPGAQRSSRLAARRRLQCFVRCRWRPTNDACGRRRAIWDGHGFRR